MADKIIFLGTGGTREAIARQALASGGIIIQAGDNQLHINPGPGSTVRAKELGINLRETTSLLVTNNSLVHANDVNAVIDAITHAGQDPKSVLLCSESVINGTEEQEPTLKKSHVKYVERAIMLHPGQKVGINELEIHTTKTVNEEDETSFGLKIYTPSFTIGYTSDTRYFEGIEEEYEDADILIINVQEPLGEEPGNGLNIDEVIKIAAKIKPTLTILTGFGSKIIKADLLAQAREAQKGTGCQVMAAKDGLTISPTGFTPKSKQQTTLEKFEEETEEDSSEPDIEVEPEESVEEEPEEEIESQEKPIEEPVEEEPEEIQQEIKPLSLDEEDELDEQADKKTDDTTSS